MARAAATGLAGLGVTFASTFASSLSLSLAQERVGFGVGILLMIVGLVLFVVDLKRSGWRRSSEKGDDLGPKALLEECYKDGRDLQRTLSEAGENRARESIYKWAERTWKVLKQHFPGHEQNFLGQGPMIPAHGRPDLFNVYCEMEIQRLGDSAAVFLESKLQDVGQLLRS